MSSFPRFGFVGRLCVGIVLLLEIVVWILSGHGAWLEDGTCGNRLFYPDDDA
jgi:hypothetical protein